MEYYITHNHFKNDKERLPPCYGNANLFKVFLQYLNDALKHVYYLCLTILLLLLQVLHSNIHKYSVASNHTVLHPSLFMSLRVPHVSSPKQTSQLSLGTCILDINHPKVQLTCSKHKKIVLQHNSKMVLTHVEADPLAISLTMDLCQTGMVPKLVIR